MENACISVCERGAVSIRGQSDEAMFAMISGMLRNKRQNEVRILAFLDDVGYVSADNMVCNGEIYNYKELKEGLDEEFITDSDCEVIMHLVKRYYNTQLENPLLEAVKKIIKYLDGDYAFAVYDGRDCAVVRDPLGVKPLYYGENSEVSAFASERKALWKIGIEGVETLAPDEILLNGRPVEIKSRINLDHNRIEKNLNSHDVVGEPVESNLLKPAEDKNAEILTGIMHRSKEVLTDHPINQKRVQEGKKPANMYELEGEIQIDDTGFFSKAKEAVKTGDISKLSGPRGKLVVGSLAAGLQKKDIDYLKDILKEGKIEDNLRIKRGVPFAPSILIGLLISLFIGDLAVIIEKIFYTII